jgi:hypothetical protein
MIPKPPFACALSLDEELTAFELRKPRLARVWSALTASDDRSYTSVIVPSMTLDQTELRKLVGAPFYEERLLLLLIRLRNPRAHVVYVTSQPVHPLILDYDLTLLMGIPGSHARKRLTMLCAHDSSPRPLTEKILERPRPAPLRSAHRVRRTVHLLGAVSEFGKLGITATANSPAEAQDLYDRTLAVLASETRYGQQSCPTSTAPQ